MLHTCTARFDVMENLVNFGILSVSIQALNKTFSSCMSDDQLIMHLWFQESSLTEPYDVV